MSSKRPLYQNQMMFLEDIHAKVSGPNCFASVSIYDKFLTIGSDLYNENHTTGSTHQRRTTENLDKTTPHRRLGSTISAAAIAMLSFLENVTDKQYFQAWAIFSSVVFISYYRWPGRRVSLPSVWWCSIYLSLVS